MGVAIPTYEWKRDIPHYKRNGDGVEYVGMVIHRTTTQGSIHDPVPEPELGFYTDRPWVREYTYQVGKVSGVGDSPSRSVKSQ